MPLNLKLDYDRGVPVYRQIFDAVLTSLANGELSKEDQLPTIHALASKLEVNPNTVARAYRELEGAGYIVSKRGLGSYFPRHHQAARQEESAARALREGRR